MPRQQDPKQQPAGQKPSEQRPEQPSAATARQERFVAEAKAELKRYCY